MPISMLPHDPNLTTVGFPKIIIQAIDNAIAVCISVGVDVNRSTIDFPNIIIGIINDSIAVEVTTI